MAGESRAFYLKGMRDSNRLAIALLAFFLLNCGGLPVRQGSAAKTVAVDAKDRIYISQPVLIDTVLASLSALGWGDGRFQTELRKELVYQFQRKGIPTVEDSAAAVARLSVSLDSYGTGPEGFGFRGGGRLRKTNGDREFTIEKSKARVSGRQDPTMDNIRVIAESVVKQTLKPRATPRKDRTVPTQMRIMF